MAEADAALETPVAPAIPAPAMPSGSEAAAILLMLLGDEEAADVLKRLDPSEVQHLGGRIHAIEPPALPRLGERLDLQAAAGAEHQHPRLVGRTLGEEQHDHALQIGEAGHQTRRPFGIARDRLRVGEHVHAGWYHAQRLLRQSYAAI